MGEMADLLVDLGWGQLEESPYSLQEHRDLSKLHNEGLTPLLSLYSIEELIEFLNNEDRCALIRESLKLNHEINPIDIDWLFWCTAQRLPIKSQFRGYIPYPDHTDAGGKWLIFVPSIKVNEVWSAIREAVLENKLGWQAKCSTNREIKSGKYNNHVICVYTYNHKDIEDVMAIRERLRPLLRRHDIVGQLRYKTDKATRQGLMEHAYYI